MDSYLKTCHDIQTSPFVVWFTGSITISLLIWLGHYVSSFLTIGSMVMIDLRILGLTGKSQTITETAEFYSRWMWIGLAVVTFTGLPMFASDALSFCTSGIMGVNIFITALAAASGVFISRRSSAWNEPSGTPWIAKVSAGVSILLWLGTILSAVEVPALTNVH